MEPASCSLQLGMQSRHRITYFPEMCRPLEDLRVSITGGVHFDLVKRVLRDINRSGQAPEEIIQQVRLVSMQIIQ